MDVETGPDVITDTIQMSACDNLNFCTKWVPSSTCDLCSAPAPILTHQRRLLHAGDSVTYVAIIRVRDDQAPTSSVLSSPHVEEGNSVVVDATTFNGNGSRCPTLGMACSGTHVKTIPFVPIGTDVDTHRNQLTVIIHQAPEFGDILLNGVRVVSISIANWESGNVT